MKDGLHIALAIERASEYGRRFLQGVADYFDSMPDRHLDLLNPSQITDRNFREYDGWIVRITNRRTLRRLRGTGRPVVDAICLNPSNEFSTVRTDYDAIGRLAAEHFLAHRFTQFGFCGYRHVTFSDLRRNAFAKHLEDRGFRPNLYRPPYRPKTAAFAVRDEWQLAEGPFGEPQDADCLATWLRRLPKPVAVFCCDDFRASDVARLCKKCHIAVPGEVAILGVDNDPVYCMFGSPRLSSIDPDATALGFTAAKMLHERLSSRKANRPSAVMIPPKGIVVRASTDAYPGAPDWFAEALAYINGAVGSGISASDVFRHVGFSRTLVERTFNKVLGKTVQAEIAAVRIRAAKRLLLTTALPVKEIARLTGYGSIEYFTRKFSAAVGRSPAAFRRNNQPR